MNTFLTSIAPGSYDALRRSDSVWVTETGSAALGTATAKFRRGTYADSVEACNPFDESFKVTFVGYLADTAPFEVELCAWDITADEFLSFVADPAFVAYDPNA